MISVDGVLDFVVGLNAGQVLAVVQQVVEMSQEILSGNPNDVRVDLAQTAEVLHQN
jgi:hypothetical protein